MTLLVGVLCSDGVVIAADRQATHGAMGVPTVGQAVTKVRIIDPGDTLFASSGHVGLGQQLASFVQKRRPEFDNQKYDRSITHLQDDMRGVVDKAWKTAGFAAAVVGPQIAMQDAVCHNLLAAPFKDGLKLVEITPQVGVEALSPDIPFSSLGSGKGSADPFLGFIRNTFWPQSLPTVREGALAAFWTVKHAIDMKVSGVGFTTDVFVVEMDGKKFKARKLADEEMYEHTEFIGAAEKALRGLKQQVVGTSGNSTTDALPTPSSPPPPPTLKP